MDTPTNMDAVNYVNDAANSTTDSDTHDSADMSSTANVHTVSGGMAHDNTVAITGHDGVLPSTSGSDIQPLCDLFYSQITANNAVIRIDGGVFRALKVHPGQAWLASQFRHATGVDVLFVFDTNIDLVYMAPHQAFPATCLATLPDGTPILRYPNMVNTIINLPALAAKYKLASQFNVATVGKVPRPMNAFILYRKSKHKETTTMNPTLHNTQISKIIGSMWQNESADVRAHFKALAEREKVAHMLRHPEYQYKPRKQSELKRRMSKKMVANFAGLTGGWDEERAGALPANDELYGAVDLHNELVNADKPTEGFGELNFGEHPDLTAQLRQDFQNIPFDDLLDANLFDNNNEEIFF